MDSHEVTGTAREAAGKIEKNYGRLKEKVADTADQLTESSGTNQEQLEGTAREYAGKAERAYGSVKAKVSQAAENLTERYDDALDRANSSWNQAMELVQDNPGAAIGIGLLVGAGLGALIAFAARRD